MAGEGFGDDAEPTPGPGHPAADRRAVSPEAELLRLPATELVRRVQEGELSPVELVEASLERVGRVNPVVNAVVTANDRALEEARAVQERLARGEDPGPLVGLPVGIKDVTPVAGLRCTYGSPLYAGHVAEEDALVVRRLRAAGAVILGKTNTPEFAAGANTANEVFGPTRNPWAPALSAGGSTGGGAAALATGMVALAEGTDLGGSLRIPAAFCGVVGLRPSPGLVPTWPTDFAWDTLQVTGPMARTAADAALMLEAVAGRAPEAPLGVPATGGDFSAAVARGLPRGTRLAWASDPAGVGVDRELLRVCRGAAEALAGEGMEVEEVRLDLSEGLETFRALRGLWMAVHHGARLDRLDCLGENLAGNIRLGLRLSGREIGRAERARTRIWHRLRKLFRSFDLLLAPCTAVPPFPVERSHPETVGGRRVETYVDWLAPTFVFTLAGLPVASVPCGEDGRGLPVGLQVVGPPLGEGPVLALAARVERLAAPRLPPLEHLEREGGARGGAG